MRYLLVLIFFLPFYGLSYSVKRYTHFTKKNLNNETEIVGISSDLENGKLLVMSSVTTEFFYEVNLYEQPNKIYLLDNRDFLIISDWEFFEKTTDNKLKLYFKGILVDSLVKTEKLRETFNDKNDQNLYCSSLFGTSVLKWFNLCYRVNSESNKFELINSEKDEFTGIYNRYELDSYVPSDDALLLDNETFETWMIKHNFFKRETSLIVKITVVDGKITCNIRSSFAGQELQERKVKELEKLIEKTVISDSFYLDRIHSWYFEKYVVFNEQKE